MKKIVRGCVFETNSSMTHSCIIMSEEQANKWMNGDGYYCTIKWYNPFRDLPESSRPKHGQFYTLKEVLEFYKKLGYDIKSYFTGDEEESLELFMKEVVEDDFITYEQWMNDEYLECDQETYTTPGGENIVVYCKYGRDG